MRHLPGAYRRGTDLHWLHCTRGHVGVRVHARCGSALRRIEKPDDVESLFYHAGLMSIFLEDFSVPQMLGCPLDSTRYISFPSRSPGRLSTPTTNFYDRSYFNAHDHQEHLSDHRYRLLPNLGVKDAFVLIRRADIQTAVHLSDISTDQLHQRVSSLPGGRSSSRCESFVLDRAEGVAADLTWEACSTSGTAASCAPAAG